MESLKIKFVGFKLVNFKFIRRYLYQIAYVLRKHEFVTKQQEIPANLQCQNWQRYNVLKV